jgi:hypothetical protein
VSRCAVSRLSRPPQTSYAQSCIIGWRWCLGPRCGRRGSGRSRRTHASSTRRCRLRGRQPRPVAQGQVTLPRGICRRRLDRSRGKAAVARRPVARVLRPRGQAGLCRPRPHRDQHGRA